jgi:Trk K+ transport system NAD-binding subunit
MTTDGENPRRGEHFVVCGDNSLAFCLVYELVNQVSGIVTVVLPSSVLNHGPRIKAISPAAVRVVEASELNDSTFEDARLQQASAVALVGQNDTDNFRDALKIDAKYKNVRLVIRFSDLNFGKGVKAKFPHWSVLSDAETAAPSFASAALGNRVFPPVELRGSSGDVKLYPAERRHVKGFRVVCELVVNSPSGESELLPGQARKGHAANDLILALGSINTDRRGSERLGKWWWLIDGFFNRKEKFAILFMFVVGLFAWIFLAMSRHVTSVVDALYSIILDSLGAAQANTDLDIFNQIFQVLVTCAGVAVFIPVVTAKVVTEAVRSRYPELVRPHNMTGHVVLVGLGNLGICVLEELRDRRKQVLCVDKDKDARGVPLARRYRVPIVFGDVSETETLRDAYVDKCSALVVVTGNNVTNVTAALRGSELKPDLRAVLRLLDDDLAEQIEHLKIATTHSVPYYAAPVFTAKMLDRNTLRTIDIEDEHKVLLITEVLIQDGSVLVGNTSHAVDRPNEVQLIAIRWVETDPGTSFGAPNDHLIIGESSSLKRRFAVGDTLIIAATRSGLAQVLSDSSPATLSSA